MFWFLFRFLKADGTCMTFWQAFWYCSYISHTLLITWKANEFILSRAAYSAQIDTGIMCMSNSLRNIKQIAGTWNCLYLWTWNMLGTCRKYRNFSVVFSEMKGFHVTYPWQRNFYPLPSLHCNTMYCQFCHKRNINMQAIYLHVLTCQ